MASNTSFLLSVRSYGHILTRLQILLFIEFDRSLALDGLCRIPTNLASPQYIVFSIANSKTGYCNVSVGLSIGLPRLAHTPTPHMWRELGWLTRKLTPVTKKGPTRCFHRLATVSTFPSPFHYSPESWQVLNNFNFSLFGVLGDLPPCLISPPTPLTLSP